jgi:pimeloyl-ACP methyl ester carboxylesterase
MSPTRNPAKASRSLRYFAIAFLFLVASLTLTGAIYQRISNTRDRRAFPMPGELVDVGGYKMHIDCTGSGTPTVVLDSGLGDSFIVWRKLQPQIAQFTHVCSYDRAGIGYSDSSPRPRNSKVFAEELHSLLHNAAIAPPYVLIGHSMGGYDVRVFADSYRNEVTGMVLVDSSHPEQKKRLPPALNDLDASWLREQEFFEFTMPLGLPRLFGFCGNDREVRADDCNFHSLRESVAELTSISESGAQTAETRSLGDMPLIVLSQDPDAPQYDLPEDLVRPTNEAWQKMQNELARLSTRSRQVIAKNSGHYIQLDRPDLVLDAVREVVNEVKTPQVGVQDNPENRR